MDEIEDKDAKVHLGGLLKVIGKSRYAFAPIIEGITNSLEAISQKNQKYPSLDNGDISINFYYKELLEDTKNLEEIEIIDNGIGFDDENLSRFRTFLDGSKGYNNRGSGKIQFLHRVGNIEINSLYKDGEKVFKRSVNFNKANFITFKTEETNGNPDTGTHIKFKSLDFDKKEMEVLNNVEISDIKNEIKNRFLLRLYLDNAKEQPTITIIKIKFFKNGKLFREESIHPKDIPSPTKTGKIQVPYVKFREMKDGEITWERVVGRNETIEWANFKLPSNELTANGVFLCSKNVQVEEVPFGEIKKHEAIEGCKYLTVLYGEVLDNENNVNHSVDAFTFPHENEAKREALEDLFFDPDKEFLFSENIDKEVEAILPEIYGDIFDRRKAQEVNVFALAKMHGISEDVARSLNLGLNDSEADLTRKLYTKQAEQFASVNYKIRKLFSSLITLSPVSDTYQQDLLEKSTQMLELIPQQNKNELSRYIIRREMVTKALRLILESKLQYQNIAIIKDGKKVAKEPEGLIHDLIFKRRSTDTNSVNDLWLLNEEYVHFDGCSDLELINIKDKDGKPLLRLPPDDAFEKFGLNRAMRRPDIFLYVDEGKCVIIEFKKVEEDLSNHLNQTIRYAKMIANCSTKKIDKFYCYLIGENIDRADIPDEYQENAFGDYFKPYTPVKSVEKGREEYNIASIYSEVIKLSSIAQRAHNRNKSFAEKLGIRPSELADATIAFENAVKGDDKKKKKA